MENHFLVVVGVMSAGLVQAAEVDLSKLPPAAAKPGVTYSKDVRPLFERSCFGCHGERRQRGELRLDSLEAVLKGSEHGKVLTPGKSQESPLVIAVARLDDDTAMPPRQRQGGGGRGFGGGRGGFPFGRTQLSQQMIAQADQDKNENASEDEWSALATAWFGILDPQQTGQVNREDFGERLPAALARSNNGNDSARQPEVAGYVTDGFFNVSDLDRNGTVTRTEFNQTLAQWHKEWSDAEIGGLTQRQLYAGLRDVMPQTNTGQPAARNRERPSRETANNGNRPRGNNASRGAGDSGGNSGAPPTPLTPEEVALVRAWIDQGAK